MSTVAPIALFVYNRLHHTRQTVAALQKNRLANESDLFVYCDGAKNPEDQPKVEDVRQFVRSIGGFSSVTIIEREKNLGLAQSIITGVTELVDRFGVVIVVEDDLLTSEYFLQYMNDALSFYESDERVISVHGYCYPVKEQLPETFFVRGADCWGWGTWRRGWALFEPDAQKLLQELRQKHLEYEFDWDASYKNVKMLERQLERKVDSWAIRWHASAFLRNKLTLFPGRSLVNNIGGDIYGTHTKRLDAFQTSVAQTPVRVSEIPFREDPQARKAIVRFFRAIKPTLIKRILRIFR